MKRLFAIIGLLAVCWMAFGAETIPPSPPKYFNDFAGVTSAAMQERLNKTLEDFEKQTSSQIVVAVYPKMESDSSIEDYAVRVFRSWKVGQREKNNGALLLVFVNDHKMRIAPGYGLEGALPDAVCKRILDDEITPRFRQNDFSGGLTAGVNAMIAATKGEYRGTGTTVAQNSGSSRTLNLDEIFKDIIIGIILFAFILSFFGVGRRRSGWWYGGGGWGGGGFGGGWGGGGGGGFSGGGGGGFSGGGGSTGGGGASGSW